MAREDNTRASDDERSGDQEEQGAEQAVEQDIEALLDEVRREAEEYLALAQRTQADFENYRKRMNAQAAEAEQRGQAKIVKVLLPVLDNLERALAAAEPRGDDAAESPVAEGVRLVHTELVGVLGRVGVESYEPLGEQFDPTWQEAVTTHADGKSSPNTVIEVVQKGYRFGDEVLRPARVIVARESGAQEGVAQEGGE